MNNPHASAGAGMCVDDVAQNFAGAQLIDSATYSLCMSRAQGTVQARCAGWSSLLQPLPRGEKLSCN